MEKIIKTERVNMEINPTKRLNRLTEHARNLLQSENFSDWAAKDRISSNFDRLNEKMLVAYNQTVILSDCSVICYRKSKKKISLFYDVECRPRPESGQGII